VLVTVRVDIKSSLAGFLPDRFFQKAIGLIFFVSKGPLQNNY
jgi:hypothetical protein